MLTHRQEKQVDELQSMSHRTYEHQYDLKKINKDSLVIKNKKFNGGLLIQGCNIKFLNIDGCHLKYLVLEKCRIDKLSYRGSTLLEELTYKTVDISNISYQSLKFQGKVFMPKKYAENFALWFQSKGRINVND